MGQTNMPKVSRLLTDEIASLAESGLKEQYKSGVSKNRVKLLAIVSAKKHGIKKTSELYNISPSALTSWIKRLSKESLEGLNNKPKTRRSIFSKEQQQAIEAWLKNDSSVTVRTLRTRIEKELGLKTSKSAAHILIQKLGFKYTGVPPKNYKENQKSNSELKKQSILKRWRRSKN
jgi:transposase